MDGCMLHCRSVSFWLLFSNLPHLPGICAWRLRPSIDLSLMRQVVSLWYVKFWIHVPTISWSPCQILCSLEDHQYLVSFYIVILMSMILLYYSNRSCCLSRQEILRLKLINCFCWNTIIIGFIRNGSGLKLLFHKDRKKWL